MNIDNNTNLKCPLTLNKVEKNKAVYINKNITNNGKIKHIYNRNYLTQYLRNKKISPLTRREITNINIKNLPGNLYNKVNRNKNNETRARNEKNRALERAMLNKANAGRYRNITSWVEYRKDVFNPHLRNSKKIKYLELKRCRFTELPEWIGELTTLERLVLDIGRLTKLPDSIGNLKNLKFLSIKANNLTKLPDSIGNLKRLMILDLSSNDISSLPSSIGDLKNLEELHLKQNRLFGVPLRIGDLKRLMVLDLSENNLRYLPDSLSKLSRLTNLYLLNNPDLLNVSSKVLRFLKRSYFQLNRPLRNKVGFHEAK